MFGSDKTELSHSASKGSSRIEPGVTPARDTKLKWTTRSGYVRDCGTARLWAGVLQVLRRASWKVGLKIGDHVYTFLQSHIKGQRPASR